MTAQIKSCFSADGFGKFGALDVEEDWDDEAQQIFYRNCWKIWHTGAESAESGGQHWILQIDLSAARPGSHGKSGPLYQPV